MITLEEWAERPHWNLGDITTRMWKRNDVLDPLYIRHRNRFDNDHYRAVVKAKRMEEYRARNVIQWSKREDRERW